MHKALTTFFCLVIIKDPIFLNFYNFYNFFNIYVKLYVTIATVLKDALLLHCKLL